MLYWALGTALLLWIIPIHASIPFSCYDNASLSASSSGPAYQNVSLERCLCSIIPGDHTGFQYDSSTATCQLFVGYSSPANIQLTAHSQTCFIIAPSTDFAQTTAGNSPSPPSPVSAVSTSVTGDNYYRAQCIDFQVNYECTFLSIAITVQKTYSLNNPRSYETIGGGKIAKTIIDMGTTVMYNFTLINGQTVSPGSWRVAAQFDLSNQMRSGSNDTYSIQTDSSHFITGHF